MLDRTDMIGPALDHLTSAVRSGDATALDAARQFETLIMTQILKLMRESDDQGGFFQDNAGDNIYREMADQQLAVALTESGGLGLAELLARDLTARLQSQLPNRAGGNPVEDAVAAPVEASAESPHSQEFSVSSAFGWRKDPIDGSQRYHRGLDLAGSEGSPVNPFEAGKVIFSGWRGGYGNAVVVESSNGTRMLYAHLETVQVKHGDQVSPAEPIGTMGQTGRATGPHLHLEVQESEEWIDPLQNGAVRSRLER